MPKAYVEDVHGILMLALPFELTNEHHLEPGSEVEVSFAHHTLTIGDRVRRRYNWDELLERCDPADFERTAEDEEFLNSPPMGRELI